MSLREKSDGELLAEFVTTGRDATFGEIVRRHGTLVAGICRRILGRAPEAEDVAQAVFLTLVRKARGLRNSPSVAGWLHRVAQDLSRNALKGAERRRRHEQEAVPMKAGPETRKWEEVRPLVDQELDRLPEKYRLPLVLHYLQQRTQEEVGREMGCRRSAISLRLMRGLEMLRGRLARRGAAVSGAVLAGFLMESAASASLSTAAAASTVKAATLLAVGNAAAWASLSPQVGALVKGGLKAMVWTKLKIAAAAVAAVTVAAGAGGVTYTAPASQENPKKAAAPPAAKAPRGGSKERLTVENFEKLHAIIKPQPGESKWDKIPWIMDLGVVRRKAAQENKPIFVFGTGGAGFNQPSGIC